MRHQRDGLRKRCTCGRRTWAKCIHPWHLAFQHDGREYRFSLDVIAKARGERPPTTKKDAEAWRDRLRGEIRAGTFGGAATAIPTETRLTLGDVVKEYRARYVHVPTRRATAAEQFETHLNMLIRATVPAANGQTIVLKDKAIDAITKADVEAIRMARRAELAAAAEAMVTRAAGGQADPALRKVRRPGAKGGEVGINRLLARLRHVLNWAIAEGYVNETPFKRQGVTVVKLEHRAEGNRERRLRPGEEAALLEHATPLLRAIIIASLATGCRSDELLTLRWSQIRRNAKGEPIEIYLPASLTKTNEARILPIGAKLRAVLAMRELDPDGQRLPETAHVFGNEVGEPVKSTRNAWEKTCAKAGISGLNIHDLRREFACRLLESRSSLHDVKDFLGHANITTTSTYLKSTPVRLASALDRMEATQVEDRNPEMSHTSRTNGPETTNGRSGGSTVTH